MVITTLTCNPKFKTYQADKNYLSIFNNIDVLFLNIINEEISIPLLKKQIKNSSDFDLITPINFQETLSNFDEKILNSILLDITKSGAVCLYLQTKNHLNFNTSELINLERFRTNYYFDITKSSDIIISNMKRDAKQRLKKVLKKFDLKLEEKEFNVEFYKYYNEVAKKNNFSKEYIFSYEQFKSISKVQGIKYLELKKDDTFFAGGFFGVNKNEIDYLYGANNPRYEDSIRLLIFKAIEFFKQNDYTKLFLGGGIRENDSLAIFKLRQGTIEQKCTTIRTILNQSKFEKYSECEYSKLCFKGFFPPYQRIENE